MKKRIIGQMYYGLQKDYEELQHNYEGEQEIDRS
jgi:hypothetical protein